MAANMNFSYSPAAAALNGARFVAHRGAHPKFMVDAGNTFVSFNAWLDKEIGFGPNGEIGILEEEVSVVLANAVKPGYGAADAAGVLPGVFMHGLDVGRWQTVWDRLVADGFDFSVPVDSIGAAVRAVREFVGIMSPLVRRPG